MPLLNVLKPACRLLFRCRVQLYWLFFGLPSALIVFIVNTRLFGELSGDYNSASALSSCLALWSLVISESLRTEITHLPVNLVIRLKKAMLKAQTAQSFSEIPSKYAFDEFWLETIRVQPRKGIQLFQTRLEESIKEIILPNNPKLVAGKCNLSALIEYLGKGHLVSPEILDVLKELAEPLNRIAHGSEPDKVFVEILKQYGTRLLITLEECHV